MCSTPYGISYRITCPRPPGRTEASRAQRLTASHIESPGSLYSSSDVPECSTPYGISYRITAERQGGIEKCRKCSTPYGISYRITCPRPPGRTEASRAQRLTASHIESPGSLYSSSDVPECSTPYGISYRITAERQGGIEKCRKCSTPYGISYRITFRLLVIPCIYI